MKGNNIAKNIGNAGKATLPNGENLSNKLQQNKMKQMGNKNSPISKSSNNEENNNENNKKSNNSYNNNEDNSANQPKGTMPSGLPNVQGMGTEAAKEGLKTAAGAVPYTKWIPKGIRDKIIDKFMDSGAGQYLVDKTLKETRKKLILILVATVASVMMGLFTMAAMASLVLGPIAWVSEALNGWTNFWNSFGHWFSGDGWCPNDGECQIKAEEEYNKKLVKAIEDYSGTCPINEDLITATIFYGQMVSADDESFKNEENEEGNGGRYFNYLDVSEAGLKQPASSQINKLIKVYWKGEEGSDDEELTVPEACESNIEAYEKYLKEKYIDWAYPSVITKERTKEKIALEILMMGGFVLESNGENLIVIGAGQAGAIPDSVLQNSNSPMGGNSYNNTGCFGYYGKNNCTSHTGIDLVSYGNPPIIYSIADGEVVAVVSSALHCEPDWKNGKACSVCANSTGNKVTIKHTVTEDGVTTVFYSEYLHLQSVSVTLGQKVSKGDKVAIMGNTGCSTGAHLHFNMYDANFKRYNPEELLQYLNLPIKEDCEEARKICSR